MDNILIERLFALPTLTRVLCITSVLLVVLSVLLVVLLVLLGVLAE